MSETAQDTSTPGRISGAYVADPVHSSFAFSVRYMGVSMFRANFSDVEARLTADGDDIKLEGRAKVESISITTPEQFRAHVLSEEFFDADKYPYIEFKSTRVQLSDDATVEVEGDLTVKGNTVHVTATGTWQGDSPHAFGGERAALQLKANVDRTQLGLNWNAPLPTGGNALADEVTLNIDLVLVKES